MYILLESAAVNHHYMPVLCSEDRNNLQQVIDDYNRNFETWKARELAKPIHQFVNIRKNFRIDEVRKI